MTDHPVGRIGPNAIIQTVTALRERKGVAEADRLLGEWGLGRLVIALPTDMVEEGEVTTLCARVIGGLGREEGLAVTERAGELTAAYLLAHRIPAFARLLLPWLPHRLALKALFRAIEGHSWTFAGTGTFSTDLATPSFAIRHCPVCRELRGDGHAMCGYYRATFEWLIRRLVHPRAVVEEVKCEAVGGDSCLFRVRFDERGVA